MSDHVHVQAERVRRSRDFQREQAAKVSEIACRVRTTATVGNAFGKVGAMAGLESSYLSWVEGEASSLEELTRMLTDLSDGLAFTADDYDGVDQSAAERVGRSYRAGS
ncbi:type VII secretion target [Paractinoplanes rhizophilus]|uniref:Type VII secretion target n=1 Tax=Paractinoplanes rhizophilus TaxID=1416877 RepID=A0ABW2HRW6_9ACTN